MYKKRGGDLASHFPRDDPTRTFLDQSESQTSTRALRVSTCSFHHPLTSKLDT
jgi:hypothetical protein